MQISILFKTLFQILIDLRHSKTEMDIRTEKILMNTSINVFIKLIPHKFCKLDHKTPEWINKSIISLLKKGENLSKYTTAIPVSIITFN